MQGFLITYNCKFTFCLNEAKKLLLQFSTPKDSIGDTDGGGDIDKMLKQELDSLNDRDKEFTVIDTGAKYTLFIHLESVDTNQVAKSIYQYIEKTQKPIGRYVQRLMPILNTCKAHMDDIEKCIKSTLDVLEPIQACAKPDGAPFKFSCVLKNANNHSLSRDEIFKMCGVYFNSKNSKNKVDFDQPDYVLNIGIICNIAFISFVDNYFNFRKYNIIEMGAKFIDNKKKETVVTAEKSEDLPAAVVRQKEQEDN